MMWSAPCSPTPMSLAHLRRVRPATNRPGEEVLCHQSLARRHAPRAKCLVGRNLAGAVVACPQLIKPDTRDGLRRQGPRRRWRWRGRIASGSTATALSAPDATSTDGVRSWRMGRDSNPRWACTHAGFQDRCLKPLGHPSSALAHLSDAVEKGKPEIVSY